MESNTHLFDLNDYTNEAKGKGYLPLDYPLWTKNKAHFIARYLKSFTYVTRHGTYIDAFAGPQHEESRNDSWAAKLVMQNEPAWLRNFHLFDLASDQIGHLKNIKKEYLEKHPKKPLRTVTITEGDCNTTLPRFLNENPIQEKEASFCLFDQRSTECAWETVKYVAEHKGGKGGHKIELFYFLPQGWIDRTIKSWKNDVESRCLRWWGRADVLNFLKLRSNERGIAMADRFREELGYKYSFPFPIQKFGKNGAVMFWMIHASDHSRATDLMRQSYNFIGAGGGVSDPCEQFELKIE
ncbi:hypothetical protein VDG1235_3285 [Verrucomicrobiia bacterium DG1235]|nr:hypothetical protein VDG1235_3285 [Verrucomicrobiae bacterium DG1235]